MIYPENPKKDSWDLFMNIILMLTCIIVPLRLAFGDEQEALGWVIIPAIFDILFLMDIIVIFNTAYYDEHLQIVDDRKKIAG